MKLKVELYLRFSSPYIDEELTLGPYTDIEIDGTTILVNPGGYLLAECNKFGAWMIPSREEEELKFWNIVVIHKIVEVDDDAN